MEAGCGVQDDLPISRTRVSRRLKAHRVTAAADERELALVLVKLAQLAADVPEIRQMSLNPLLVDDADALDGAPIEPVVREIAGLVERDGGLVVVTASTQAQGMTR